MKILKSIYDFFKNWYALLKKFLNSILVSNTIIRLENLALKSQLMEQMEKQKKYDLPKRQQNIVFKQLWVMLSKLLPNWKSLLYKVKPETVIRWHRTAFRIHWRRKLEKRGRPTMFYIMQVVIF